MSWLGPASSGAHPRTKGARFCTGGHRHRIPLTTKGLRVARAAWQAIGGPFAVGGRNTDQQNTRETVRGKDTFRSRSRGRLGGTRTRTRRRCALGVPQGMRDTGHAFETGCGPRETESVRRLCGRCYASAKRHAWAYRIRPAACLCSLGSDCTTRMGRSCRCAGASLRRTAGMLAHGEA